MAVTVVVDQAELERPRQTLLPTPSQMNEREWLDNTEAIAPRQKWLLALGTRCDVTRIGTRPTLFFQSPAHQKQNLAAGLTILDSQLTI